MIKAIIFDIDGVLVDSREAIVLFYQIIMEKAGYARPTKKTVLTCFHKPLHDSLMALSKSTDEKEIDRLYAITLDPDVKIDHLYEFPDELDAVLEEIHQKYKLAVVTARLRIGVEEVFRAKEIGHFFDVVISHDDYENPKPHPEPLHKAVEALGVTEDEAIYIGDSHTDIDSATAAGMRSIHLSIEPHEDANVVVTEFGMLPGAIGEIVESVR